jgi:hypothetical protein
MVVLAILVRFFEKQKTHTKPKCNYYGTHKVRKQVRKRLENSAFEPGREGQRGASENAAERRADDGTTEKRSVLRPDICIQGNTYPRHHTEGIIEYARAVHQSQCTVPDRPGNQTYVGASPPLPVLRRWSEERRCSCMGVSERYGTLSRE